MTHVRASEWWLDANGARIAVRVWEPEGRARGVVCIIHGLGEHSRRYAHVVDTFTGKRFAVVAPDLRGHGRSSGPRGHAASVGQLLVDVSFVLAEASQRMGALPLVLYGHSMGGAIALTHALRRPDTTAACIVTGPAIRAAFTPPPWKVAFGRAMRRIAPSMALQNEVDADGLSHDAAVVRSYRADPLVHDRISVTLGLELLDLGGQLLAEAPTLRAPTLIVHGELDPITSAAASREFARLAGPVCTYYEVSGSYHEVHHEASWDATWRVMDDWLSRTLSGDSAGAVIAATERPLN